MSSRQREWPRQWLMTDERLGDRLWEAIERLPAGSGIVFRHYALERGERANLAADVAQLGRMRGLTLAVAHDEELASSLEADLVHNPAQGATDRPFSRSVHSLDEAKAARSKGAALVFVSPVFETRSHPGRTPLGINLAKQIAEAAAAPAIALGGMNAWNFALLEREGFYGWGGIDAWLGDALRT